MRILLHPTTSYSQPTRIPIASYRLLLASYPQECASSSCFTGLPGDVWTTLDSGSSQFRDPGFWTTLSHLARPARLHLNLLDLYVCILLCHILLDSATSCATPDSGRLDLLVPTSTFASCLMRIVFPAFVVLPLDLYSWSCLIMFFYLPVASRLLPHATSCRFMRHVDIHCSTLFLLPWAWVRPVAVSPGNINSLLGDRIGLLISFGGEGSDQ